MKQLFIGLITLYVANSFAANLLVNKINLEDPFYRSLVYLNIQSDSSIPGNVIVSFMDRSGISLNEDVTIKIRRESFTECKQNVCVEDFYIFPASLERFSCFVNVKFISSQGNILFNNQLDWGKCEAKQSLPDSKFFPDLAFSDEIVIEENVKIGITNLGQKINGKPLKIWGFLKDNSGRIIWSDEYYQTDYSIDSRQSQFVSFTKPFKQWQKALGCKIEFHIDPDHKLYERSKLNNVSTMDLGLCENIPSYSNGDRIDFEPISSIRDGVLNVDVLNIGRLPFLDNTTNIESFIRYLDSDRKLIFMRTLFTPSPLYGFEDRKKILSEILPQNTCHVEIEINPNITIKENDYINNRIQLSVCE